MSTGDPNPWGAYNQGYSTTFGGTVGNYGQYGQFGQIIAPDMSQKVKDAITRGVNIGVLQQLQEQRMAVCGTKPVVVCNGQVHECKDLDEAKTKAEDLAHQHSMPAYILKPIIKVAPKRDTVTTELA